MRIVVLDGYSVNPGDLSWDALAALGDLKVYDDTPNHLIFARAQGAEAVFVNRCTIDAPMIHRLSSLKFIGTLGTGYNMIDLEACRRRGVAVCNVPGYSTFPVAQHIFALMLYITNSVGLFDSAVRQGQWSGLNGLPFLNFRFTGLNGKILGIIGFGSIGRQAAKIGMQFGMKVIASSRTKTAGREEGVTFCTTEQVLKSADFISINCPLNVQTSNMINQQAISLMKPEAVLINTARGAIIDEQALAQALNEGRIRAACLDVLASEPPGSDCPLLNVKNCVITPHIAWAAKEARAELIQMTARNLKAFIEQNTVNRIV